MADKKKSGISIVPEFVAGEQPTADKFNAIGVQLERASSELEKSVGDIWGESYPYSSAKATKLTMAYGRKLNDAGAISGADSNGSFLDIANIARLIGPASALNPIELSNYGSLDVPDYTTEITSEALDTISKDKREFHLNYMPSSVDTTVTFDGADAATYFLGVGKVLHSEVTAAGEWCLTADGRLTCYDAIPVGELIYITYNTSPIEWGSGPSVQGSTFNVIPDPNQTATACAASLSGDDYYVTLPVITHAKINIFESSTSLGDSDASYQRQLYLPEVLQEAFITGDTIPEGFILLRNNDTGKVYSDATYVYDTASVIKVKNQELDTSVGYSIITIGSTITESIHDIRWKFDKHSHDGSYGEPPVHIKNISGILEDDPAKGQYVESSMLGNWMPQYLHRDGYDSSETNINDKNAMRGHLVLGLENSEGSPGTYMNGEVTFEDDFDSYGIHFGGEPSTTATHNYYGPIIKAEDGALLVQSSRTASNTFNKAGSVEVTGSSNVIISAGRKTWIDTDTTLPTNTVTPGLTGDARLNLGCTGDINIGSTTGSINIDSDTDMLLQTRDSSSGVLTVESKADTSGGGTSSSALNLLSGAGGVHVQAAKSIQLRCDSPTGSYGGAGGGAVGSGVLVTNTASGAGDSADAVFKVVGSHSAGAPAMVRFRQDVTIGGTAHQGKDILYLEAQWEDNFAVSNRWNEWLKFYNNGVGAGGPAVRGGVRMVGPDSGGQENNDLEYVVARTDQGDYFTTGMFSGGATNDGNGLSIRSDVLPYFACFYSGNQDYGEWFECGDLQEWKGYIEEKYEMSLESFVSLQTAHEDSKRSLKLPEGMIVYVRDDEAKDGGRMAQFYRNGPGLPFVITNRAFVVGNSPPPPTDEDSPTVGEILSFMGQVPVYIAGSFSLGDLIIPHPDVPNIGKAISIDDANLKDYKNAVGSVMSSYEVESEKEVNLVLVAIGKK